MNRTSIRVIKSVFLSAILSLIHANSNGNELDCITDDCHDDDLDDAHESIRISKLRVYKNILKLGRNGRVFSINAHTSHNSHRSHSSHSSHCSHYSGVGENYSINPISNNIRNKQTLEQDTSRILNASKYTLGERILSLNYSGSDVDELVFFL
jgi:hypothetical protein